jgi:hypothetical protein
VRPVANLLNACITSKDMTLPTKKEERTYQNLSEKV